MSGVFYAPKAVQQAQSSTNLVFLPYAASEIAFPLLALEGIDSPPGPLVGILPYGEGVFLGFGV
jgi:hypothetical protein